jgi:CheY-like chemotaxis protein
MRRVLLIEDEVAVRDVLGRMLDHAGYEVVRVADGRQGLAAFQQTPVDVVVTDINMPEMDGIEVISALRRLQPRVPIVAISGGGVFSKQMLLASANALGADEVVSKPFDLQEIVAAIRRALGPGSGP